jgi:hypothetical protein
MPKKTKRHKISIQNDRRHTGNTLPTTIYSAPTRKAPTRKVNNAHRASSKRYRQLKKKNLAQLKNTRKAKRMLSESRRIRSNVPKVLLFSDFSNFSISLF